MLNTLNNQTIENLFFKQIKAVSLKNNSNIRIREIHKDLKAIENAKKIEALIFKQIK